MKVQIYIRGQINGNFKLRSALNNGTAKDGMFNSFHIYFDTIREAKKAIREGRKYMKQNEDNVKMSKDARALYYDASKAVIINL